MVQTSAALLFLAAVASICSHTTSTQASGGNSTAPDEGATRAGRSASWSSEEAPPFWANRGRRQRLPWLQPGRRDGGGNGQASGEDLPPFWANRGRREGEDEPDHQPFQEEEGGWTLAARDSKRDHSAGRSMEDRDRRGLREALSKEEPFWAARGRRGLREALSKEEPFWAARGRRGLREALSSEDTFWASRGRRAFGGAPCAPPQQSWRKRQTGRHSADIRTLGKGQSEDPFWPVRGKRAEPVEEDNEEDDRFWAAFERRASPQ